MYICTHIYLFLRARLPQVILVLFGMCAVVLLALYLRTVHSEEVGQILVSAQSQWLFSLFLFKRLKRLSVVDSSF